MCYAVTMNVEKTIRDYLPRVIHMSLGTSKDNKPWVSELHFVFDERLNLYFRSKTSHRHSQEIAENENVAGNIIVQHSVGQDVRGVYFEGKAKLLTNVDEDHPAYKLYCERFDTNADILKEAGEEHGHKFYRVSVDTFYVFDNQESVPAQKYELPWLKK